MSWGWNDPFCMLMRSDIVRLMQPDEQPPQEAPSSRLEEFTTTRNEAEKLKARWAAEKKKEVCDK